MSFRGRLTLFFLLIVVLPMIAVAVFVLQASANSQTGKADARLAEGLDTSLAVYRDELDAATARLRSAATDPEVAQALASGSSELAHDAAGRLASAQDLETLAIVDSDGHELARVGHGQAFAPARVRITGGGGGTLGSVVGSVTTVTAYVARTKGLTGRETIVKQAGRTTTTIPVGDLELPAPNSAETVTIHDDEQRAASALLRGGVGGDPTVTLLTSIDSPGLSGTRPLIFGVVAVFFLVALAFIVILLRALNAQTGAMLDAARRIGGGDFSREVPVEGNDEMAGLAREFNKMSDRLESQMADLRRQRIEIEASVRRIGDAFAAGLDRPAVLQIVAETAMSACAAEHARIAMDGLEAPVEAGKQPSADPQRATEATGSGTITISRAKRRFTDEEREVLRYLAAQASTSIENIDLHDRVSEQAVTDELTGLANNRALRAWLETESERALRFGHSLSLLILDLDDFKRVNDTYGHLQGDEVLRALGRVLREASRGIDEPARYGGEEFAVGLPETGTQGAYELADRIRVWLAEQKIAMVDGDGTMSVTASIGVATLPDSATDVRSLFAAADEALYRAKRAGKNRVEVAGPARAGGAEGQPEARRT